LINFTANGARLAAILLTVFVAISVYLNALSGDFVHDDVNMVLHNPWITDVKNIPDMLFSNVWAFDGRLSNFYRPLAFLVYTANYYIFGLDPWGFHLTNVALHAIVSVLVLLLAARAFQHGDMPTPPFMQNVRTPTSYLFALAASLMFATHPIHTEPVAWISGITDLLYSMFFLLALYYYIGAKPGWNISRLLSLICFFLAALSKETALTLPIMLFAFDLLLGRNVEFSLRGVRQLIIRYLPFASVAAVYLALRTYALGGFAPVHESLNLNAYEYIINVFPLFAHYLQMLVLPLGLNIYHGIDPIRTLGSQAGVISVALLLAYVCTLLWLYRQNRLAAFYLAWIVIPLLPVFYLPALAGNPFSERYLYLPSVGFVMLAIMGIHRLSGRFASMLGSSSAWMVVMVSLIITLYSITTIGRNAVWASNITLWEDAVRKSPEEFPLYINLATAYFEEKRYDEALTATQQALHIYPRSGVALYSLGSIYFALERMPEAIDALSLAVRADPRNPMKRYHLGTAYAKTGMPELAIDQFRRSVALDPNYAAAYFQLGLLAYNEKRWKDAVSLFERAVRRKPGYSAVYLELGKTYEHLGELSQATRVYQEAVRLDPSLLGAHRALGLVYEKTGDFKSALKAFLSVVESEPSASGFVDLGRAYLRNGMRKEAEKAIADALALEPANETARNMLRALPEE